MDHSDGGNCCRDSRLDERAEPIRVTERDLSIKGGFDLENE